MSGRLAGKVALVTGAGSVGDGWGNGRATAVRFAQEGARVLACDRSAEALDATLALIAADGGEAAGHVADVTREPEVAALVGAAVDRFGGLDVLVNNVGGSRPGGPETLDPADWHAQIDLNLTSVYLLCRHALPALAAGGEHAVAGRDDGGAEPRGGGAIVNVASTSGIRFTGSPQVAYAAAKAGVLQLSRVVAVEYAARGVRVNTVVPGQLHTPMVEARLAGQRAGGDVDALLAQRQARIPLGFMGDGRDTAAAALFLASDEARFVTGAEIVVDGGMTARCD